MGHLQRLFSGCCYSSGGLNSMVDNNNYEISKTKIDDQKLTDQASISYYSSTSSANTTTISSSNSSSSTKSTSSTASSTSPSTSSSSSNEQSRPDDKQQLNHNSELNLSDFQTFFLNEWLRLTRFLRRFKLCSFSDDDDDTWTNNRSDIQVKLLLIGLDNAGKTTLALHLAGESVDDVVSTIGFSKYELSMKNPLNDNQRRKQRRYKIVLYDVGGGSRIRGIWKNYYSLVHGIIFVIDSVDFDRILEVKQLIQELVANPTVSGKPILIYLNKQDIHEAMDEIDVCKFTNLEETMVQHDCMTKIVPISAKNSAFQISNVNVSFDHKRQSQQQKHVDPTIESGLKWLLGTIHEQWPTLNERVQEESQKQINKENDTMRQRINKIQQRNLIDVESKVSTKKTKEQTAEQSNNEEILKIIPEHEESNPKLSPEEQADNVGSGDDGLIVQTQNTSASSLQQHRSSTMKRGNKIHPTSG